MTKISCDASMSCIVDAATALSFVMKRLEIWAGLILVKFIARNMGDLCCILVQPMAVQQFGEARVCGLGRLAYVLYFVTRIRKIENLKYGKCYTILII